MGQTRKERRKTQRYVAAIEHAESDWTRQTRTKGDD